MDSYPLYSLAILLENGAGNMQIPAFILSQMVSTKEVEELNEKAKTME